MSRSRQVPTVAVVAASMLISTVALADASTGFLFALRCNEVACDIVRWQLDGTSPQEIFAGGFEEGASGLAVDPVNEKIYYGVRISSTPLVTGRLERCAFDGSAQEILLSDLGLVGSVAVDPFGGKVYFEELFPVATGLENRIRRANLDGSSLETIVSPSSGIRDVDVNPAAGKLYWIGSTIGSTSVNRANLDGSSAGTLLSFSGEQLQGVAAGSTGKLYVAIAEPGRIIRIDLAGLSVHDVLTQADFPGFQPGGVVVDRARDQLYFSGVGGPTYAGLWRVDADGSGLLQVLEGTPSSGFADPDLAVPGNAVVPASSAWSLLVLIASMAIAAWMFLPRPGGSVGPNVPARR